MEKQNFTRSNVNESTLNISAPNRSGFDMSHVDKNTFKLGIFHPVSIEYLTPTDMFKGSLNANIQLEKVMTPELGEVRLDTHHLLVHARRINKDWRQFAESGRDFANIKYKPIFKPHYLMSYVLAYLLAKHDDQNITPQSTLADLYHVMIEEESDLETKSDIYDVSYSMITAVRLAYQDMIGVISNSYGYMEDFFAVECKRLETAPETGFDSIAQTIDFILQPYFGVGSVSDAIGYPLYRQYSRAYAVLFNYENSLVSYSSTLSDAYKALTLENLFMITGYDRSNDTYVISDPDRLPYYDEMPYRAVYAAWYDHMRNFHVEKRDNLLDPDNFDSTAILAIDDFSKITYTIFINWCQLLLPKYRMYMRDGLTTVQEEDIYRRVYVPIVDSADGGVESVTADYSDIVSQAINLLIPKHDSVGSNLSHDFLSDNFNQWLYGDESVSSDDVLRLDLQTMKRAGMLQKFLARDFYNPDTYAGWIRSRYSAEPADIEFLSSVLLGGNEIFMNGEQLKSPVTTDATPAGQRTFTGGVDVQDSFSYRASDFAYVVSFVSLVPRVTYDAANMHAQELTPMDLPMPEFADDTRVMVVNGNILRDNEMPLIDQKPLGYVPRYYGYRTRLDSAHGLYLTDKRDSVWLRDTYNIAGLDPKDDPWLGVILNGFALDAYHLRVHVPVNAFLSLQEWDFIAYGTLDFKMFIDRPLPAAVEYI